jgi:hypothetical protein
MQIKRGPNLVVSAFPKRQTLLNTGFFFSAEISNTSSRVFTLFIDI